MGKLAIWISILSLLIQAPVWGQNKPDKQPRTTKFTSLKGKVQDSSNQPIDKFTVEIKLYSYSDDYKETKLLAEWKREFESGEYSFEVDKKFKLDSNHWMSLEIFAEGYAKPTILWKHLNPTLDFDGDFEVKNLKKGVKLTGTLLPPFSSSDTGVISGKVSASRTGNDEHFHCESETNDDGQFSFWVPEDSKIEFAAYAANGAKVEKEIVVPKFAAGPEKSLGDIRLADGVQVCGRVLEEDGEPAAGQVIVLWQMHTSERALSVAITDEQGKFELAPRCGKYEFCLTRYFELDGKAYTRTGKPIFVKARTLELNPDNPIKPLELKALPFHTVTGSVAWEDGTPAKSAVLTYSYDHENDQVKSDTSGQFELKLPEGVEISIYLHYEIREEDTGKKFEVRLSDATLKRSRRKFKGKPWKPNQIYQLKPLTGPPGPLEFQIVRSKPDERSITDKLWDRIVWGE